MAITWRYVVQAAGGKRPPHPAEHHIKHLTLTVSPAKAAAGAPAAAIGQDRMTAEDWGAGPLNPGISTGPKWHATPLRGAPE
ncbi:hypothetical protein ABZT23_19300 [Streptomyces sp. NPDC005386]|uniref:hypothetical protein n=1 Tax=Streptomyces sp. NPDC005386 TaxID=3154562 RepID=UPI00339E82B5